MYYSTLWSSLFVLFCFVSICRLSNFVWACLSVCLSICLFLVILCFTFCNFLFAIFVLIWATSLDELFVLSLVARHCASYCFIVFQFILYFAQVANKLTWLDFFTSSYSHLDYNCVTWFNSFKILLVSIIFIHIYQRVSKPVNIYCTLCENVGLDY